MDIEITDSALNQMIFALFAMFMASGYEERSDEGYKQAGTIAGSPGFESWEKDANRGEVTVIVANRFVVQATGRRVSGIDLVKKAVETIDLAKLATPARGYSFRIPTEPRLKPEVRPGSESWNSGGGTSGTPEPQSPILSRKDAPSPHGT